MVRIAIIEKPLEPSVCLVATRQMAVAVRPPRKAMSRMPK